jgi:hypothetical protein
LIEDFSDNQELVNLLHNTTKIAERESHISLLNKKLLDVIGKKYDLNIGKFELSAMLGNQCRVQFAVNKIN